MKNNIRFITAFGIAFCAILLTNTKVLAQQDPQYTQYMFNSLALNPAYAGSGEVTSFTFLGRKQWVGIDGGPTTGTLSFDAPFRSNTMGVGVNLVVDKIGVERNITLNASYAYRIKISEKGKLALGLQGGFTQFAGDYKSVLHSPDKSVPDAAFMDNVSKIAPNVGAGIWYNDARFYAGISAPRIINWQLSTDAPVGANGNSFAGERARQFRHYFLTAGYVFDLKGGDLKLKPSILVKAVQAAPIAIDINANLWFYEKFGVGLSYRTASITNTGRTGDSIDLLLEAIVSPNLRFGYAYDYSLTDLRNYNSGSHEIMLRYEFTRDINKILSPRYF